MTIEVKVRKKPDRKTLQLYYQDPLTGQDRTRSAKSSKWRVAEREAERWQQRLERHSTGAISWEAFRDRVTEEYLPGKPFATRKAYLLALNCFERHMGKVRRLDMLDGSTISRFVAKLRRAPRLNRGGKEVPGHLTDASIANRLRHLKTLFRWAVSLKIMPEVPPMPMPRMHKRRHARGRPLTPAEFQQMLSHCDKLLHELAPAWRRFLEGLWLSGLRIEEARRLQWDRGLVQVDLDGGRFPRIIWQAEGHKARRDEITPLTPDFAEFLQRVPPELRTGEVFPLSLPTRQVTPTMAIKTISDIGRASGICVNETGKHATAHDLRRSFGTRWAMRVRPVTLQRLMRHSAIETTLRYYVDLNCDDVGAELWGQSVQSGVQTSSPDQQKNAATACGV